MVTAIYGNIEGLIDRNYEAPKCSFDLAKIVYENINKGSIAEDIADCPDFLNRQFAPFQLSAVHFAVIGSNDPAMEALRAAGANLDSPDFQKYTPLHHAAMIGNLTAVSKLLAWGANPKKLNAFEGTYADLLRFNKPFRESGQEIIDGVVTLTPGLSGEICNKEIIDSSLFSAHKNENYQVDESCWNNDVKFVHENVVRTELLPLIWQIQANRGANPYKDIFDSYQKYIQDPTPLAISKFKSKNRKTMCGVFALRDIKKGEVIAEYAGEIAPYTEKRDPTYVWEGNPYFMIDGEKYRSAGSMINAGFPNAMMFSTNQPTAGFPERHVMVAFDDIAKGDQITTYYGAFYRFNPKEFVELRPEAKEAFLKKYTWSDMSKRMGGILSKENQEAKIDSMSFAAKVEYLICSSLEELATTKQITQSDLQVMRHIYQNYIHKKSHPIAKKSIDKAEKILKKTNQKAEL